MAALCDANRTIYSIIIKSIGSADYKGFEYYRRFVFIACQIRK
jgi:hypothetical protein